jgi:hypothetical protein
MKISGNNGSFPVVRNVILVLFQGTEEQYIVNLRTHKIRGAPAFILVQVNILSNCHTVILWALIPFNLTGVYKFFGGTFS